LSRFGCALRLLAALTLLTSSTALFAQLDPMATDARPFAALDGSGIDAVSPVNGSVQVKIPLWSIQQRGNLSLDFFIRYASGSFSKTETCLPGVGGQSTCTYRYAANDVHAKSAYISSSTDISIVGVPATIEDATSDPPTFSSAGYYWGLTTPDGGTHKLANAGNHLFRSEDGTGWVFNESTYVLTSEDGVHYVFAGSPPAALSPKNSPATISRLLYVEDANGNQIHLNYTSYVSDGVTFYQQSGWTDTMGRTIPYLATTATTDFSGCTGSGTITAAVTWTPPGGEVPIKLCDSMVQYNTDYFQGSTLSQPGPHQTEFEDKEQVQAIQSVVLPDDSAWTFQYTPLSGSQYNYGELTQITLPTGGTIGYVWAENYQLCPHEGTLFQYNSTLQQRILNANDGTGPQTWTYSGGTTTDPLGDKVVHTLTGLNGTCSYFETQRDYYDSKNNKLRTETTSYFSQPDMNRLPEDNESPMAMGVFPHVVTTIWPNGATKSTTYTYDSGFTATSFDGSSTAVIPYGKVTQEVDTDYGSGSPGPTLRTTATNYEAFQSAAYLTNNLLDLVSSATVTDGPTGRQQSTSYGYDESSLVSGNASSTPDAGWTETPLSGSARGNQTSISRYWDTSGATLETKQTYTNTGLVSSITEPSNAAIAPAASTSYQYSGSYDGAYLTGVTDALGRTTQYGRDGSTGLMTSLTDQNNVTTLYSYDAMNRLHSSSRPAGSHNLAASIGFDYPDANTVTKTETLNSSIPDESDTTLYDGFGRVMQTQHDDPEGTVYVDTTYDQLGRRYTVSTPYRSKSDLTSYGLTTYSYDGLGRTIQIENPDSSIAGYQYAGATTLATTESNGSSTPEKMTRVDGLGRLKAVCEINSSTPPVGIDTPASCGMELTGTGFLTAYIQTTRGMTGITQGEQSRSFIYDSLGQLTDSTNPETGHIHYTYDPDGNVVSRAANAPDSSASSSTTLTTSYSYDALHRLIGKSYTGGSGASASTPSASYSYDQASVDGATLENPLGHLTSEETILGGAVQTKSIYSYDNAGSVESHYQCVLSTCPSGYEDVERHYDGAEDLTSQSTPQNGFTYTYDQAGNIIAMTPQWKTDATHPATLLTAATYAPNGGWSVAYFGNLTNETYTYTPRWLHTMQVAGYNPTSLPHGTAAISIGGAEQSAQTPTTAASAGRASFTVTGQEKAVATYVPPGCNKSAAAPALSPSPQILPPCRSTLSYDVGTLTVSVNGHADSFAWSSTSTAANSATALASAINGDSGAAVTASVSGAVLQLVSKVTGSGSNYGLSATVTHTASTNFPTASFGFSSVPAELTGGANAATTTTYDSGTLTITVDGSAVTVPYGQGSTAAGLAQALVAAVNGNSAYPASLAVSSGSSMTVTAREGGAVGNYPISFTTTHSSAFANNSFAPSQSGANLSGGENQDGTQVAIYDYSLGHAPDGQITSSTDSVNGSWAYTYDNFNRLQTASETNAAGTVVSALAWDYDRYGNRWHQRVTGGSGTTQMVNYNPATNQATSNLTYDAAGDVLSDGFNQYQYDAEGRIASVNGAISYIYDAEGRRVGKTDGTRYIVGLGGEIIDALQGTSWQRTEVYAGGWHLATVSSAGVTFDHGDWIGTERARTSAIGELCQETSSEPFGDGAQSGTPSGAAACSPTPDFLTGKPRDSESNLDDFGARYFNSRYGQWMSPDWSGSPEAVPYASLADPQSLNLYAYAGNDPVDGEDPDGHSIYSLGNGIYDNLSGLQQYAADEKIKGDETNPASDDNHSVHCNSFLCKVWELVKAQAHANESAADSESAFDSETGISDGLKMSTLGVLFANDMAVRVQQLHQKYPKLTDAGFNAALLFGTDGLGAAAAEGGEAAAAAESAEAAGTAGEATAESAQMKRLSKGEIDQLKEENVDPHDLKPNSRYDLFKNKDGDIFVKPKRGNGPGEPTGINIKDFSK
jgi:RHS repeat-associated protein